MFYFIYLFLFFFSFALPLVRCPSVPIHTAHLPICSWISSLSSLYVSILSSSNLSLHSQGFQGVHTKKKISWASGWDFFIFKVGLGFYSKVSKTKKGSPGPPSRQGLPGCLKVGSCLGLMLWQLNDVRWCLLIFFIAFYVCCLMFVSL